MNATAKSGSMPDEQPAMMEIVPVGAIVLTLRSRVGVRHQSISAQLARTRAEAVEVVKVPIGGGVGD